MTIEKKLTKLDKKDDEIIENSNETKKNKKELLEENYQLQKEKASLEEKYKEALLMLNDDHRNAVSSKINKDTLLIDEWMAKCVYITDREFIKRLIKFNIPIEDARISLSDLDAKLTREKLWERLRNDHPRRERLKKERDIR